MPLGAQIHEAAARMSSARPSTGALKGCSIWHAASILGVPLLLLERRPLVCGGHHQAWDDRRRRLVDGRPAHNVALRAHRLPALCVRCDAELTGRHAACADGRSGTERPRVSGVRRVTVRPGPRAGNQPPRNERPDGSRPQPRRRAAGARRIGGRSGARSRERGGGGETRLGRHRRRAGAGCVAHARPAALLPSGAAGTRPAACCSCSGSPAPRATAA